MDSVRICQQCRQPLPETSPAGICPHCLATVTLVLEPAAFESIVAPEVAKLVPLFPQLEIIELLGMGGMGMVYKARQPQLDRLVALKILPMDSQKHPSFAERFSREARALARLNHPGIVDIYDFGQTGQYCYFVMEFVDGMNLRQLLDNRIVTPRQTLEFVVQICAALQYAHDEGVVHRDIKPANILVHKKGHVKIADFGLVKLVGAAPDTTLTTAHAAMGTPDYMAPEQREDAQGVDHRADIFSLGVVFYEMLTGEIPMGRFEPPSKKAPVDARLDEVVLRALEREPARRYQHASEIKSRVEAITDFPDAGTGSGWLRLLRHRPVLRAAFFWAVALIIGAAVWLSPLGSWLMDTINPPTIEERLARARKSLEQYDLKGHIPYAIRQLELAEEKASPNTDLTDMTDTHAWLGFAYWRQYRDTESIEDRAKAERESAHATNMDNPQAYLVQGLVASDKGSYSNAVQLFLRANALYKEENCLALIGLAENYAYLRDSTTAAWYIERARQVSPKNWSDYFKIGDFYFHSGNNEAARTNFEYALRLTDDGSPLVWRNLAGILAEMHDYNDAMRDCDKSLKLRKTPQTYAMKGGIFGYESNWTEAAAYIRRAADLRPDVYQYWGDAALMLLKVDRLAEAREDLTKAVEQAELALKDHPACELQAQIGLYKVYLDQTNEAYAYFSEALEQCPSKGDVLTDAIDAYVKLRDQSKADPLIERTLVLAPDDPTTLEDAIDSYGQLGETEKVDALKKKYEALKKKLDKIKKLQQK